MSSFVEPITPPSNTVQGQQTQQGNNMNLATIQQGLLNGQQMTPVQSQQVNDAYSGTNALLAQKSAPSYRQGMIDDSSIPAMQQNYSDLATKLAQYDTAVLKPQFAGTDPGIPTDMPSGLFGRTTDLSVLTPNSAKLPADQGLYNTNPLYAYQAQGYQADALSTLLGSLNETIGKELTRNKGDYIGTLATIKDLLPQLTSILKMNTDLEISKANRAASSQDKNLQEFNRRATEIKNKFLTGGYSTGDPQAAWGQAWNAIKVMRDNLGLQDLVTNMDIDDTLGGSYNAQTGEGTGLATKENLRDIYLKGKPVGQQNAVLPLEAAISNIKSARENYKNAWKDRGLLDNPLVSTALGKLGAPGEWISSTLNDAAYNYVKDINGVIASQVAKGIGGEVGNLATKDVERAQNELANLGSDPGVGQKRMDKAVMHATQGLMRLTKDKIVAINPTTKDKVQVDTAEELEEVFDKGYTLIE